MSPLTNVVDLTTKFFRGYRQAWSIALSPCAAYLEISIGMGLICLTLLITSCFFFRTNF